MVVSCSLLAASESSGSLWLTVADCQDQLARVRSTDCSHNTLLTLDMTNSDAEFRMMFLLNNMDINQEGQLSSEDRLFSSGTPRYQSQHSQVNPFGAVRWEGGRPVYSAQTTQVNSSLQQDLHLFSPQQQQQQQCLLQQQMILQQQQQQQQRQQQQRTQIEQNSEQERM